MPLPYCLANCGFIIEFETRKYDDSNFVRFSGLHWLFGIFGGCIRNLKSFFSISVENAIRILTGISLNLCVDMGYMDTLAILVLPVHKQWYVFRD